MYKYLNWRMIKRIWSHARREGDFPKLLITNIALILFLILVPYFSNSWLWKIVLWILINLGYIFIRAVLIELKIINVISTNPMGVNGEITFPISETSNKTTMVIIVLENGLYTVKDSHNVASITDYGYGDIGINFITPFKNSNFICNVSSDGSLKWEVVNKDPSSIRIKFKKEPKFFKVQISE